MRPQVVALMVAVLLGAAAVVAPWAPVAPASAATAPITQCNGYPGGALPGEPTGAAKLVCQVTVTNNLDAATGLMNSSVSIRRCVGAANSMPLLTNCQYGDVTTVSPSTTELVDHVTQCNDSSTVGGSTLICYVTVVNNVTNVTGAYAGYSAASVDQCVGTGGDGSTALNIACDPYPATTTNAAITQCNGSAYGGGATINCTVAADTLGSALPMTVNQCNDSVTGGGEYLDCRVRVTNLITLAAAPPVAPAPPVVPVVPSGPSPVIPPTAAQELAATGSAESWPIALGGLALLLGGFTLAAWTRRRTARRNAQTPAG